LGRNCSFGFLWLDLIKKEVKTLLHVCPSCKKGILKTIFIFNKYRPPPLKLIEQLKKLKSNLE